MKAKLFVIGLFLFALAACTQRAKAPEPAVAEPSRSVEGPTAELLAIDSLLWHQPDSALACLLPCFDTCIDTKFCVSTATAYNRHYANLLLSELLYKNDYAQVNRTELLQAVAYFDSLVRQAPPLKGAGGIKRNLSTTSFLAARAHYINGVGYYENDSVVEACAEYLKTLEVMESHFEEKDLVGKKAKFMTYTYNRLGDMFSEQFMMEPAIASYKNSYKFSLISPISSYSVSNALYHMGIQFNIKGEKDSANYYYSQALMNMPDSTNPYYRDVVSNQSLLSYQLTHQAEASIKRLKQIAAMAGDEDERLTRYLVIGDIYFEEGLYDSALLYLESVMENKENSFLQKRIANYLRIIYDSLGNKEKSDEYKHYLALHNETGAENSALVSQLSDLFKNCLSQKQEKEAEAKREASVKKVLKVIVPIAIVLALAIIVAAKLRSKKLLKKQREEANRKLGETEQQHKEELRLKQTETEKMLEDKEKQHQQELETERHTHKMQQAALSSRLKRSNEELRELKGQLGQRKDATATAEQAASFTDEPICRLIMERVNEGQFKSKVDYVYYKDYALDKQQLLDLRLAADRHFGQFTVRLKKAYPELTNSDLDYCCLYLLGLTDADIAALMQRAYNTVIERNGKLKKVFGKENTLSVTLKAIANGFTSV